MAAAAPTPPLRICDAVGACLAAPRLPRVADALARGQCAGTLRLQNAEIGATLDCTGATFSRPRFRRGA